MMCTQKVRQKLSGFISISTFLDFCLILYARLNGDIVGLTDIIDAGGNMTVDGLRGASISYNILNLPEEVCLGNEKVSYIYTSAGEKLATRVGEFFDLLSRSPGVLG